MPIVYDEIMQLKSGSETFRYTDRDVMLYALGVGFGRDPLNLRELKFVYENDLQVVPTFASVIGWQQMMMANAGVNLLKVVYGEQRLTSHKPLPFEGEVASEVRVAGVVDNGVDKGALILLEKEIREKPSGDKLCTLGATIWARGDGGFGGPDEGAPVPHAIPERQHDHEVEFETRPDQAMLYALSGDRNPLHRDPLVARMAGYRRPILHGLCTYGIACRAVLASVCGYDPKTIESFDARFSAPVTPGESIVTQIWKDGPVVSFRCKLKNRGLFVLDNGKCTLRA
jgi:acyl dehydratase